MPDLGIMALLSWDYDHLTVQQRHYAEEQNCSKRLFTSIGSTW